MTSQVTSDPQRRICYINFASHLLNAYNPNMMHLGLPYRWSDQEWFHFIDMIASFGFNVFEFWLEPRLFCREGLQADYGREFTRQMNAVIDYARACGLATEMLIGLATVGSDWRTLCPNDPDEWAELVYLWETIPARFPNIGIVGIFPGDPGACSRNGCTAETYIDRSIDAADIVKRVLPGADIEFGTWGPPFFGWGNIKFPPGWKGEFLQDYQHTAWDFDPARAERSMQHLIDRLPDFPVGTAVAINMGFNSDGNPAGAQDARPWARKIAGTHPILTWDFSLTEGENAIFPHYRFERLFQRRQEERAAAPYSGGICFTMTPLLNQLSLYESAQSFLNPQADHVQVAGTRMKELVALLQHLEGHERDVPFHPSPQDYRRELLFFAQMFADLSAPAPDFATLQQRYWQRVYAIYDRLPAHVDPRPHAATQRLMDFFKTFALSY
ncbi:MAG: hypothetical protein M1546_16565 [Chloroflexi bacterium]|nr:hypothetical protein [Chloroflexota bacterium]